MAEEMRPSRPEWWITAAQTIATFPREAFLRMLLPVPIWAATQWF